MASEQRLSAAIPCATEQGTFSIKQGTDRADQGSVVVGRGVQAVVLGDRGVGRAEATSPRSRSSALFGVRPVFCLTLSMLCCRLCIGLDHNKLGAAHRHHLVGLQMTWPCASPTGHSPSALTARGSSCEANRPRPRYRPPLLHRMISEFAFLSTVGTKLG